MAGREEPGRKRGRPPKDPVRGAASDRDRAAAYRARTDTEVEALVFCLRRAMHALDGLGDTGTVGWMFWGDKEAALDAIRRRLPEFASEFEALVLEAKAQANLLADRWHGPPPVPGRRKGSLAVGGSEFWLDETGTVMRNGRSTGLCVNREYNCWTVVDIKQVGFKPRRHYVSMGASRMALLDAALIAIERSERKGSP